MNIKRFIENNNISYYNHNIKMDNVVHNPKDVITAYLAKGDKESELSRFFLNNQNSEHRIFHMMSVYLLGILLYKGLDDLKIQIDKIFSNEPNIDNYTEFLYWWFQICFIHDLGYALYEQSERALPIKIWNSNNKNLVKDKANEELLKFIENPLGFIPAKLITNSYKYSQYRSEHGKEFVDHGILAGTYYYKNRKDMFKKRRLELNIENNVEEFIDNARNLRWSQHTIKKQKAIAEIIIGHNIFLTNIKSKEEEIYKKYAMESLISNEPLYKHNEFSLFFLFQLVDTLDPYKWFKQKFQLESNLRVYQNVLSDISFDCSNGRIIIRLENQFNGLYEEYADYLNQQKNWLPINVRTISELIEVELK